MPLPSPFHPRTAALCTSLFWKEWAGFHAVRSFDTSHDREYFALRHGCGLIDVSPLYKCDVRGADAAAFLARVMVRDVTKLKIGRVAYTCWCDDEGKVIDDGTVTRLDKEWFRVTAAEPLWFWLEELKQGFRVQIEDMSEQIAVLSLQGPNARALIQNLTSESIGGLGYFRARQLQFAGQDVVLSRTGYTGDLGFELWMDAPKALPVWDAIVACGSDYGLLPTGLDAMDVARIEAGYVMNGVDYQGAHHCLIEPRKTTPDELGLGWMVRLDREPFIGQAAIEAERERGSRWCFRGVIMDWVDYEIVCQRYGLPPEVCSQAWRTSIPLYNLDGRQIGYATSGAWSPILKQNLALATLAPDHGEEGGEVRMEVTVEHTRHQVKAKVVKLPFFDPPRKKAKL